MSDQEFIARLRGRSQFCKDRGEVKSPDLMNEAATRIEQLTAKLKVLEKVELRLKTMYPETSGHYFICGEGGVKDDNGLPEQLHICPAFGADYMMTYQRTDKAFGPEY